MSCCTAQISRNGKIRSIPEPLAMPKRCVLRLPSYLAKNLPIFTYPTYPYRRLPIGCQFPSRKLKTKGMLQLGRRNANDLHAARSQVRFPSLLFANPNCGSKKNVWTSVDVLLVSIII